MVFFKEAFHQTLAATNVNLNAFMIGIGYGWIAPTLVSLRRSDSKFSLSAEEISWLVSIHEISHTIGPIFSIIFLDKIGRKNCFIISSFLLFLTWLLTIFSHSILLIYSARLIFGFAISINEVTASIYLAENCSPSIRGIICSLLPLCFYAGIFGEFIVATYLPYKTVAIVNTIIGFIGLLTVFQLKETPYFLVMKGHTEAAKKILKWLNGNKMSEHDSQVEIEKINENIQMEKQKTKSYLALFSSPENLKTILIVFLISLLIVLTGFKSVNSYASTIFLPSSIFSANEFTILLGIIQFMAACISPLIVERFNRRTLLMLSFSAAGLSHGCTFVLFKTKFISEQNMYFSWLVFTSVAVYSFIVALNHPAVLIIRGELLPISVKAVGGFLAVTADSVASFVVLHLFPIITQQYGIEINFAVYCIAGILGCLYVYWKLPETKGKSLVDIQTSLKDT